MMRILKLRYVVRFVPALSVIALGINHTAGAKWG